MPAPESASKSESDDLHQTMLTWASMLHAATFLKSGLDEHLRSHLGIGLAEQDLLKQLASNASSLTLTELAKRIYLSKAGITKMLDRLEKQQLLSRKTDPNDRRAYHAVLTDSGRAAFDRSKVLLKQFVVKNFGSHLSSGQLEQMQQALQALLQGHGRWQAQLNHLQGNEHAMTRPAE